MTRVAGDATWMFILCCSSTFNFLVARSQTSANNTCLLALPLPNHGSGCDIRTMSQPTTRTSLPPQLAATNIFDWLKPSRSEAIARLRTNCLGLLTIAIVTNLLPLPSPWTAIATVRGHAPVNTFYYGFCALGTWSSVIRYRLNDMRILQRLLH